MTSTDTRAVDPRAPHGVIVFDAEWTTGKELHMADLDAGSSHRVGAVTAGHLPRFSPDGRDLVFNLDSQPDSEIATADVHVLDLKTEKDRLVGPGSCPSWTSDGKAFIVYRPDGLHRLATDGSTTLIEGGKDTCGIEVTPGRYVLWDQNEHLEMLENGKRRSLLEAPGCGIGPVDLDSDRARIAYTVTCDDVDADQAGLWVMDLSSGDSKRIMTGNTYGASWSPDGGWIATTATNEIEDGKARTDLWVACVNGCDPIKVYEGGVNGPTWGPPQ